MALTLAEAQEYLDELGLSVPNAILVLLVNRLNDPELLDCLSNYGPDAAKMVLYYLLHLFALVQVFRYISSERAPSGASRSFTVKGIQDAYKAVLAMLRHEDPDNCTGSLIPDDPFTTNHAGMWVGEGGCYE